MKFNILKAQKKGSVSMDATTNKLIGAVIVVVLVTAFAPTIFENVANLSAIAGVPAWLGVILPILIGVAIMYMIWRAMK